LIDEEKEIAGHKCRKASCDFRGRHYSAWYAPDIAIAEGPYVFSGLPGLILEISDSREHYHFKIDGFISVTGYDPIYIETGKVVESSRSQVRKAISNTRTNPVAALKGGFGDRIKLTEEQEKQLAKSRPYNPIELE
jgi:GLPGLI family protein